MVSLLMTRAEGVMSRRIRTKRREERHAEARKRNETHLPGQATLVEGERTTTRRKHGVRSDEPCVSGRMKNVVLPRSGRLAGLSEDAYERTERLLHWRQSCPK